MAGDWDRDSGVAEGMVPTLDTGPDIGVALKTAREFRGLSLQDVADQTRIRRTYLAAIEEMRLDELPSRPFTIGYVRAYANALGLDGEAAVERFKTDEPASDEPLREPVGVRRDSDPRLMTVIVAGVLILGAILLWNFAQRAVSEQAPKQTAEVESAPPLATAQGPVTLGAPLPAPVESTTPTPYETPGLEAASAANGSADAASAAAKAQSGEEPAPQADLPQTFEARGKVYGVAPEASSLVFQARKPASLIVRGTDGSVYFARQLAAGESYRAPLIKGVSVEVSEAGAIQAFQGGQSLGLVPIGVSPVVRFVSPAPTTP